MTEVTFSLSFSSAAPLPASWRQAEQGTFWEKEALVVLGIQWAHLMSGLMVSREEAAIEGPPIPWLVVVPRPAAVILPHAMSSFVNSPGKQQSHSHITFSPTAFRL